MAKTKTKKTKLWLHRWEKKLLREVKGLAQVLKSESETFQSLMDGLID